MIEQWPWFAMGIGIAALFLYRYVGLSKRDYLESPSDFLDIEVAARDISVESEPKREIRLEVARARAAPRRMLKASATAIGHDWMPMAISLLVLLSALFVILSNDKYGDAQQKWAFGAVGTILGYWFKR